MTTPVSSYTTANQMPTTSVALCGSSSGFINPSLPQVGISASTVIPYSSVSITTSTATVTTTGVVNTKVSGLIVNPMLSNPASNTGGPKRMRAIAPKPLNVSAVGSLGMRATSALTTISKSGSKRHGLVTPISGVNGVIPTCASLQVSHAISISNSISNLGMVNTVASSSKLLNSQPKKVSLPLVSVSSTLVRPGRGRRRAGVGQQPVSTTFVTSAHASPICITNSINSAMGMTTDTSSVCSMQPPLSLPLSSPSAAPSFFGTQPLLVPSTSNPHITGPVLPSGPIQPTLLFGNSLPNAPSVTMPNGMAPFLFQQSLPISNSCSQFSNSVFSPATCTISISPSTSCPLAVVRSLPSVTSATIFATNSAPTMASIDPTTGLVTYYPSSCISMNNPYASVMTSSTDSSSISIPTVCSQPNHTLGLQPSSQSAPVMYPIQTQQLLPNQLVPTIFPNLPTDVSSMSNFTEHTAFLQSFTPGLIDTSCISSNEQMSSESTNIQSQMTCQNAFYTSNGNYSSNNPSGNISIFSSLPVSTISGLPSVDVTTSTCETNGPVEDETCLAKDDLISLAWHLTQMEDGFATNDKQNADALIGQTEDENNVMFEDFLQAYSQNTTGFNFNSDLNCSTHGLDQSSGNHNSSTMDKDVIVLDNEPEYTNSFENTDGDTQLTCTNEESTGNADIDALLAAAAMVGAASGVGDAQSAVAVPLPSSSLASVSHQTALDSECNSSPHATHKNDDVGDCVHLTFASPLIPAHSSSCKFSPLLVTNNAEDSVDNLKEPKPDGLIPSDLFDDFSKTEVNEQFPNEVDGSVHEFDDGYEPTSLAAVLGCNAQDAADLESVLGQEAPDLSEGGGVSDSFLHSLVGPSPTVDDLNDDERGGAVDIFDNDFHSPHESKPDTENDLNFHSVHDFPTDIDCEMVSDVTDTLPVSKQVRSLLRDTNTISVSSRFGSPSGGSKSFNHFFEATSRRLNRSCRYTSDIDDDFIGVDFSDAVNGCTTAEQFDEALMLLGPQPNSPINQSEMQSENTIPVSVTDFVSHIEDKMKNNENAVKGGLLSIDITCSDVKDVMEDSIMTIQSNSTPPRCAVVESLEIPIPNEESNSQRNYAASPISEIEECMTENNLDQRLKDENKASSINSPDKNDSVFVVAIQDSDRSPEVKSQQMEACDDATNISDFNHADQNCSSHNEVELPKTFPPITDESQSQLTDSNPNPSTTSDMQNSTAVQNNIVDCRYSEFKNDPRSILSTYLVYNIPKRPQSVSPKILFDIIPHSVSKPCFDPPPRPRSLPNLSSVNTEAEQRDYGLENTFKSHISDISPFCNTPPLVTCSAKQCKSSNKSSPKSDQHLSINTGDIVSNISILGVLASSSALVEAVADLGDDSDISPVKSSIEGLASLDRMLKSCQRRSQQTLKSTGNASSSSESVMISSSQTSSLSQTSAIQTVAACDTEHSRNIDICSSTFIGWQNTDVSSQCEVDSDVSVHESTSLPISNADSVAESFSPEKEQIKVTNTARYKRGRRKRTGHRKPNLSYLKKGSAKTSTKFHSNVSEVNSSENTTGDTNEANQLGDHSVNPSDDVSINNLLELAARRPHSFGLSSVDGNLSSVPNPPILPQFECHLPPLVLAAGTSLFPESQLLTEVYSPVEDVCSVPQSVAICLKVEPDEADVSTGNNDEKDQAPYLTPQRAHHIRKHRKRRKHISDMKLHGRFHTESHSTTKKSDHPHFDFDKANFVGVNPGLLKGLESLGEAPFERFLHDTRLQTFATLKPKTGEAELSSKSNHSSWSEKNVVLFGGQYSGQSASGDGLSLSTQNMGTENHLNETQSDILENSILSSGSDIKSPSSPAFYNHNSDKPVPTTCESSKYSVFSQHPVYSTPVSHTFNTLPTLTSSCCLPISTSPFHSHAFSFPVAATITQSVCESSSSTSHSLEKVFPVISPLPINRNVGIAGSFAGAAAFRATSFSALAAKVEKTTGTDRLSNPPETLWKNVTFADLAKVASSNLKNNDTPQNSCASTCSSWFVDKSMQIDASALLPKPLFQPSGSILTPHKNENSPVSLPVCSPQNVSPSHSDNQLSVTNEIQTPVSLTRLNSSKENKRRLKRTSKMPKKIVKRKRSANKSQSHPFNTIEKPTLSIHDSDSHAEEKLDKSFINDSSTILPVRTLNNEPQESSSNSEKVAADDCDPSVNNPHNCVCPDNEIEPMEEENNVVENIVVPTVAEEDQSISLGLDVDMDVSNPAETENVNTQPTTASPPSHVVSSNCEQSLAVPIDFDKITSQVISTYQDETSTKDDHATIHAENTTDNISSPPPDILVSCNQNVSHENGDSSSIALPENDEIRQHPPIKLRLNLKLAQLRAKSPKRKKRKKLRFNNPVIENKCDPVIEMKSDPPKCSLSIRLVNRIPLVKEISKPISNDSNKKRKKKLKKINTKSLSPERPNITTDNTLQSDNVVLSSYLENTSNTLNHITDKPTSQDNSTSDVCPKVTAKDGFTNRTSTKKIFSTARQERRSNYAQLTRPWRASLSTSPRKRSTMGFRSTSSRRNTAGLTRSSGHLSSSNRSTTVVGQKEPKVMHQRSMITGEKLPNNDVSENSYTVTSSTGRSKEAIETERSQCPSLRLVIRLGKSSHLSRDELANQSAISPLTIQVPSDMSSASSEASTDKICQQGNVNIPVLERQSNEECIGSARDLPEFCVASEAETFMDPNQFQIHRILNRALPMNSGLIGLYVPSPGGDDDGGNCGVVDGVVDSEHRMRLTDQPFSFPQVCHENHVSSIAPRIGCTAGLSSEGETKSPEQSKCDGKSVVLPRYRYGKSVKNLTNESNAEQSSNDLIPYSDCCKRNIVSDCIDDPNFPFHQPTTSIFSTHQTDMSEPDINYVSNSKRIHDHVNLNHSSPDPSDDVNATQTARYMPENRPGLSQKEVPWCETFNPNLNHVEEEHHIPWTIHSLSNNTEIEMNNSSLISNNITSHNDETIIADCKSQPKFPNDEAGIYPDMPYSQQVLCCSAQTRIFDAYNSGVYANGSSGSGFGGSCSNTTGSSNSISAPSTGSPAPLSLGPGPGSQPEYSSGCTGSINESFCCPLSPPSVNRDFHCSPVSGRVDMSAPAYAETQPTSQNPYSQFHENRLSNHALSLPWTSELSYQRLVIADENRLRGFSRKL
uniref:Uncharacterized protein n=1 Tax=Trichobilharzia regenti TaxID=157069 RepID=A0AA85JKG4_TRIRE|nr:unnamed protein product [Trichobilharzia regenti]